MRKYDVEVESFLKCILGGWKFDKLINIDLFLNFRYDF